MKKLILSVAVIVIFLTYVIHERNEESEDVQVIFQETATKPTLPPSIKGTYKDGTYTGPSTDAFYGNVQVQAVITNGKITNVLFLDYPHDRRTSERINSQAMPFLKQEAISAQSAEVDIVSGATDTSLAFRQSLKGALEKAKL